ncbi:MAG: cytochrome P460 family protein [Sulfuritalea sp.]|nr:cytochrome P460 family protein [Sulfuritalea sp.]
MLKQSALVVALATAAVSTSAADVAYPEKFRDAKHVKSMVINNGHPLYNAVGGMHHIYGNAKAIAGYKAGKFANGSVITFDLFEAVDKDNAVSEGARKAVVVMAKDSKKYAATDGWGYQVFDPKTKKGSLDARAQAECHACHVSQKDKDFVFSSLRN